MKKKKNVIFLLRILFALYIAVSISLVTAWAVSHAIHNGEKFSLSTSKFIIEYSLFPSKIYNYLINHSIDSREIVNINTSDSLLHYHSSNQFNDYKIYFLVSTFSKLKYSEVKLLNAVDFAITKQWMIADSVVINNKTESRKNMPIRVFHPILLKDSSIVFSADMLFRVNKENQIIWMNSSREFHHSIEIENDTVIWTGSKIKTNKYFNFGLDTIRNDALCALNIRDGSVLYEKPVADILIENGYSNILQIGKHETDLIHLNDIEPVMIDTKYWKKGDLFISIRHRNTVFLYRPSTNKILWLKTGPWLSQHDIDVVNDSTVMIFGNDVLRGRVDYLVNGHNDIYFYDFKKDSVYTPYTKMMKKLNIATKTQGRCELLPNGDLFIDDTNSGTLYIITPDSLKMKYVERIDDKHIKMFNWVRPIFN